MTDDRDIGPQRSGTSQGTPDIPPEAGRRAHVLKNGEVRGSGVSAGGGNPGEEYDPDEHGGEGPDPTGVGPDTKGTPAQGAGDREPGGLNRP